MAESRHQQQHPPPPRPQQPQQQRDNPASPPDNSTSRGWPWANGTSEALRRATESFPPPILLFVFSLFALYIFFSQNQQLQQQHHHHYKHSQNADPTVVLAPEPIYTVQTVTVYADPTTTVQTVLPKSSPIKASSPTKQKSNSSPPPPPAAAKSPPTKLPSKSSKSSSPPPAAKPPVAKIPQKVHSKSSQTPTASSSKSTKYKHNPPSKAYHKASQAPPSKQKSLSNNSNKMSSTEQTFIAIKPDGVQRGLVGPIISRFENRGFKLVAIKLVQPSQEHLETHYADLKEKPFFPGLVQYMKSGPICAMVWEGLDAVKTGRTLLGATNPLNSAPGTIRGDFALSTGRNVCHGSDSVENAKKEIALWFKDGEVQQWKSHSNDWLYE